MLFLELYNSFFYFVGYCVVKCGNPFMITKTCRFAARRARPARYKGGLFGGNVCPRTKFKYDMFISKLYIGSNIKRFVMLALRAIAGQSRALRCLLHLLHNLANVYFIHPLCYIANVTFNIILRSIGLLLSFLHTFLFLIYCNITYIFSSLIYKSLHEPSDISDVECIKMYCL